MGTPWIFFITIGAGGALGWYCGLRPVSGVVPLEVKPIQASAVPRVRPVGPKPLREDIPPGEFKIRLEDLLDSPVPDRQAVQLLMARWVEEDLEGAKAWVRAFPEEDCNGYQESSQSVKDFFKAWAALDPNAALMEALGMEGAKGETSQGAVIAGLARADFSTIQDILKKLASGGHSKNYEGVHELMKQLMARDRPSALALAMSLEGQMGTGAVHGIVSVWARTDPGAALTWARQHPDGGTRERADQVILTEWARQDPLAAGPMLLQKRDGQPDVFHSGAAAEAVAQLSKLSPEAAAKFVKDFYPQDHLKANLSSLFFRLMQNEAGNPQSAAAMCAVVNVLPAEILANTKLWRNSWMSDLKPSWDRLLAEPDSPGRHFLLGEIGQKLSAKNPLQIVRDVMRIPNPGVQEQILKVSFSGNRGSGLLADTQEFRKALESMPPNVQSLAASHLAWTIRSHDPAALMELFQQYPAAAEAQDLLLNIGIGLPDKMEVSEAQTWMDRLPTDKARGLGYAGIVSGYYREDSIATSEWVSSLPEGIGRDNAAQTLAREAKEDDPGAAFAWAASIQDVKLRDEAAGWVIKSWSAVDRTAALQAVEQSALPAEEKTALLKSFPGQP